VSEPCAGALVFWHPCRRQRLQHSRYASLACRGPPPALKKRRAMRRPSSREARSHRRCPSRRSRGHAAPARAVEPFRGLGEVLSHALAVVEAGWRLRSAGCGVRHFSAAARSAGPPIVSGSVSRRRHLPGELRLRSLPAARGSTVRSPSGAEGAAPCGNVGEAVESGVLWLPVDERLPSIGGRRRHRRA